MKYGDYDGSFLLKQVLSICERVAPSIVEFSF
jgi:hypothetical protein